jgi:hypothetical protein
MKMGFVDHLTPGSYQATFDGVEPTLHDDYGSGVRWKFRIDEGEHAGVLVGRTTKDVATAKNSCGRFLAMVAGCSVHEAAEHDTDDLVGVSGTIVVEQSPSGQGVRVGEFVRDDSE